MRFNFKELNQKDFTYWMFINLLTPYNQDQAQWDKLQTATNNWTDINITMQINGVEVDTGRFIELVKRSLESRATEEARDVLDEALPGLDLLQNEIVALEHAIKDKVAAWAREHDIDIDLYRDY